VLPFWIVLGIVVLVLLYGVLAFNSLVRLRNRTDNGWSQIDVQLRRRYDLIPNLVQTVQGYAAHEKELFEHVAEARSRGMGATSVAEQYPDLRANQNFLALQEELTGTESKIAYARQFYNDQVMRLNTKIQSFPSSVVANLFHVEPRAFFDIEDPARGPVKVDL
jgi:LemA protein